MSPEERIRQEVARAKGSGMAMKDFKALAAKRIRQTAPADGKPSEVRRRIDMSNRLLSELWPLVKPLPPSARKDRKPAD